MDKFVTKTQMQTILDNRPKGVSMDEVINGYRSNGYKVEGIDPVPEQTLGQKLATTGKETLSTLVDNTKQVLGGKKDIGSGVLQNTGAVAEGATKAIGDVITSTPVVSDAISSIAKPISAGVKAFQGWLANNPTFQKSVTSDVADNIASVLDAHPDIAKNAEAVNSIANAILIAKGGVEAAGKTASLAKTGTQAATESLANGAQAITESPIVQGASTILKSAGENLKRVPERIATNIADKQASELAIKSLPSQTAQNAVRNGIDIADVKAISDIPRTPQVQKLIQTVKDFAQGKTKTDPIEVVGQPLVQGVKKISEQAKKIGAQLGDASKTIGVLTKPELQNGVLTKLKSVPGLEGITLTPKGLSFKGTSLEGDIASSISDKKSIQQAFNAATKWGDGEKAHLFRQTLFEDIGGKKRSNVPLTATEEKAKEAIRSGLSDVIETKSPTYKKLSNEYRKAVQPISELRKLMKNIDPNSSEDILNMSAGLLARRITSAAASNPQIRQLMQKLDKAAGGGKISDSVTKLQDLYNILNKYYDIAPKTGFQNLVKEGVTSSDTMLGMAKSALRDVAGNSNAVRQKALENLIEELSKQK